ncbi:MAG: hypothetical protein U1F25_12780 [Rubrivivax sp.]
MDRGISPLEVLEAFIGAGVALAVFGVPAAIRQHAYSHDRQERYPGASASGHGHRRCPLLNRVSVTINTRFNSVSDAFPSSAQRCGWRSR